VDSASHQLLTFLDAEVLREMNHPPSGFGRRASQGSSGSPVYSGECDRDARHAGRLQLRYMDLAAAQHSDCIAGYLFF
jgi:hypothetical protein